MMVKNPPEPSRQDERLYREIAHLRHALRQLQTEREMASRRQRRHLLAIGVIASMLVHIGLLIYFGTVYRGGTGGGGPRPQGYEFALVFDEQLTDLDEFEEDLSTEETPIQLDDLAPEAMALMPDSDVPAPELAVIGVGAMPALGGTGEGFTSETGLAGGAGTTYFGISAKGTRFAYIVDRSGSMAYEQRMEIAMRELVRSIQALPDFAFFQIVLFSSTTMEPPMQRDWIQARRANVARVVRWLREVDPGGGTLPRQAFIRVMNLEVRPDVIYFMTDGIISSFSADEVNEMNSRGKHVTIHTIAFGDQGSEELLRQIARDSGGTYRYIPDGGS